MEDDDIRETSYSEDAPPKITHTVFFIKITCLRFKIFAARPNAAGIPCIG